VFGADGEWEEALRLSELMAFGQFLLVSQTLAASQLLQVMAPILRISPWGWAQRRLKNACFAVLGGESDR
jgi:hypothetical protein